MPLAPGDLPAEALRVLGPSEEARVFTWAQAPVGRLQGGAVGPVISAMTKAQRVLQGGRQRRPQQDFGAVDFPLDRSMAMLVTNERLVVFRATRLPRRIGDQLTERRLDEVQAAALPNLAGGRWRGVVLEVRGGAGVRFDVDAGLADTFVAALRGG